MSTTLISKPVMALKFISKPLVAAKFIHQPFMASKFSSSPLMAPKFNYLHLISRRNDARKINGSPVSVPPNKKCKVNISGDKMHSRHDQYKIR